MILVTGGTGLVGSHLLYELVQKGQNVRALVRDVKKTDLVQKIFSYYSPNAQKLIEKIDWVIGDILDLSSLQDAFEDITEVFHCAAIVSFEGKNKNEIIRINSEGTANIVNLGLEFNIKKLCHVSSIASLGDALNGELTDENSKWIASKNRSAYSVSKYKSEMEVWRGIQEGLHAVIVNPSVILGPGFWNNGSGSLFATAAKGMKYYTLGGTGFVDVRDVAKVMVKLMDSEITNERFILNSENLIYKDLFGLIADETGAKKPKKNATHNLLKLAATLDGLAGLLGIKKRELTKDIVRSSLSVSKYSNRKIREALNYEFIPINQSIKDMAALYKKDLMLS